MAVENLAGFEEKIAVIDVLKNKDTRLLMKELIWKDHCTLWLLGSEGKEVTLYSNGEVLSQSAVVEIPFKVHGKDVDAQIIHRDNGTSERPYATVAGSASVLEKPMQILEKNARYQAIVENLEEQGYTVKEESAQVVKSYTPADYASVPSCIEDEVWNTASINVKAVRGDEVKYITALVCIDKSKVLAVADGYWDCVGERAAHFALEMHICYYPCLAAVAAPNPSTWGAYAACIGAPAAGCAVSCALPWYFSTTFFIFHDQK